MRLLDDYRRRHPEENGLVARFMVLLEAGPEALLRTHRPGHITASAVLLSPDGGQVLLTHHRKLDIWIQLGGHADGDQDLLAAALREAEEESGLAEISPAAVSIVDLDIHGIPAHGTEGAHDHYDVRFCFTADPGHELTVSDESHDLAWVPVARLADYSTEESLHRAVRRAVKVICDLRFRVGFDHYVADRLDTGGNESDGRRSRPSPDSL